MKNFKKLFILSLFSILSISVNAQRFYTNAPAFPLTTSEFYFIDNEDCSLIIDRDLTTNKEYLTYLAWLNNIFGEDFPEVYYRALPYDTNTYKYLFNPEYANDPVKNVGLNQAENYCHWKSDRYNEFLMIREGLLVFYFYQMDEENFSTESYLCDQYEGVVKNLIANEDPNGSEVRKVKYDDYFFIPSFHVASKSEINYANLFVSNLYNENNEFNSDKVYYITDKWLSVYIDDPNMDEFIYYNDAIDIKDPLKKYRLYNLKNHTFPVNDEVFKSSVIIPDGKKTVAYINGKSEANIKELKTNNILINPYNLGLNNIDRHADYIYYSSYNEKSPGYNYFDKNTLDFVYSNETIESEKDSLGKMPYFTWTADEKDGTPILLKRDIYKKLNQQSTNDGFYCVLSLPYRIQTNRDNNIFSKYAFKKPNKQYKIDYDGLFVDNIENQIIKDSLVAFAEIKDVLISNNNDENNVFFVNGGGSNSPFYKNKKFINIIANALLSNHNNKVYAYDNFLENYKKNDTLTIEQIKQNLSIDDNNDEVKDYQIKELHLYDKDKKLIGVRTLAICPVRVDDNFETGVQTTEPTFWIDFNALIEFSGYYYDSDYFCCKCNSKLTYYEILLKQLYSGTVIKTSPFDINENKKLLKSIIDFKPLEK